MGHKLMICLQLTMMPNPFVPKDGQDANTSDSSTVRLILRDANGDFMAPGIFDILILRKIYSTKVNSVNVLRI